MDNLNPIIHTKLRLPFIRPDLISRPRLQEQMKVGLRGPLTLITAPAGFGKTTLIASYITGCGMPVAWLSLDENDNQTGRFLSYLVAAFHETDQKIGSDAAQILSAAYQEPSEAVLTSLINDLEILDREIILVLDDYQHISNQAVHEGIAFLLDHCPKTLYMLIASRSDPPLPLARLRACGQAVELRAADLRFTEPEAAHFLNDVMGLRLDARSVAALAERTEGWIAGLQMAALSIGDREDVLGFIESFSGTNRYILDYLLDEVLASQPREIQHFLLYTSILQRLTAPLCESLLTAGEIDSSIIDKLTLSFEPNNLLKCQPILEYLERANHFLEPLDDERTWYRYHTLFADLLCARLQLTRNSQDIAALHTRAAQWYQDNGFTYEAIHHASLNSNIEWVEQLIEKNYMEMFHRGEASSMRFWMGRLSNELIFRRPWLCIYEAQSHALFGQLDEAEVLIAKAEEHLQSEKPAADTKAMLGHLAYIKSRVTGMRGDMNRAIELSLTARENTSASNQALQSGIGVMLGVGYFLNGDFSNATQVFYETIQSGITAKAINGTVAAYCYLARICAIQGHLHKSYDLYREAGNFAEKTAGQNRGVMSLVDMGIANTLYELNDLENALTHIQRGLKLMPLWGNADDIVLAYTTQARILQAQGNIAGSVEDIEIGSYLIQTRGVFSFARDAVRTAQVNLWLAQGDFLSAGRWAASQEERLLSDREFGFENELTRITLSQVYMAQKKPDEAIRLLTDLEESAESGGRMGRLIEILILKALTLQALGETALALAALGKSLLWAEPEGYIRIFINENQPMQALLAQWLSQASPGHMHEYATQLLTNFDDRPLEIVPVKPETKLTLGMVEPLTPRELEVLKLICEGDSNQMIADKLIITLKTVKKHTGNILGKLGVSSRAQAIVRSSQLGLFSKHN
jgi:LuxR family maltose regulon positive regulatory protein